MAITHGPSSLRPSSVRCHEASSVQRELLLREKQIHFSPSCQSIQHASVHTTVYDIFPRSVRQTGENFYDRRVKFSQSHYVRFRRASSLQTISKAFSTEVWYLVWIFILMEASLHSEE